MARMTSVHVITFGISLQARMTSVHVITFGISLQGKPQQHD